MFVRYFLLFIYFNSLSAFAITETLQVYRWTDNSGVIHLSEFPPEDKNNSFNVEKIQVPIPVSESPKGQTSSEQMANIKKYIDDRKVARELQLESISTAKSNKENCELARENLALYQSGQRIRTSVNDSSAIQILSEQERIKRIKRSEKNIQSYCGNNR
ncbi:DUF4124 domain-containing protein [uncultured Paraglaciecola sp.]|uniref:DUF4124 domain-containing protein n=1 Tax=uncultured Paraglaciecola sp. TaxID=1765024 RepID=UPI0030D89979|tara:strand:+ start:92445 stop:92921 length:477 start_codon:yes stop_codon:yes gene_type:complete